MMFLVIFRLDLLPEDKNELGIIICLGDLCTTLLLAKLCTDFRFISRFRFSLSTTSSSSRLKATDMGDCRPSSGFI